MDNDNIIIRQATIQDRDKIWSFLKLAYKKYSRYKFPERWNWQYLNNPNWKGKNLPIWLAIKDGEIIGQSNALFSKVKIGDFYKDINFYFYTVYTRMVFGL